MSSALELALVQKQILIWCVYKVMEFIKLRPIVPLVSPEKVIYETPLKRSFQEERNTLTYFLN